MRTFLIIITFFSFTSLYSQDSTRHIRGLHFGYFPSDLFIGIHAGKLKNRHEQLLIAELGLIRTGFQQRIFPQIGYQYAYLWANFTMVRAGTGIRPLVNMLHVNRAAKNGYVFSEAAYLNLFLEFGKKGKIRATGGFGPWFEQKYASLDQKFITTFKWQYFAEISLTYDF